MQKYPPAHSANGAHCLPAFGLSQIDGHISIKDCKVGRLAAALHKPPKERPRSPREISGLQIGIADDESAGPNCPPRALRIKMNEPLLLEGGQQAMGRRYRERCLSRDVRQGRATRLRRDKLDDGQRTRERLDAARPAVRFLLTHEVGHSSFSQRTKASLGRQSALPLVSVDRKAPSEKLHRALDVRRHWGRR